MEWQQAVARLVECAEGAPPPGWDADRIAWAQAVKRHLKYVEWQKSMGAFFEQQVFVCQALHKRPQELLLSDATRVWRRPSAGSPSEEAPELARN